MKDNGASESPKRQFFVTYRKAILPISTTLVIFTTFCFTSYNISDSLLQSFNLFSDTECNIFKGNWVPFPEGPYYTNATKCDMEDRQNCMKFGRPDNGFMKWRWRPERCELPLFDGRQFLELVRGKTVAFVGDSVARNQMQSLKCLLASVADSSFVSDKGSIERWIYKEYNFTLLAFWSPHLLKAKDADPRWVSPDSLMNLYTDEADSVWANEVADADVVIFSAGQWFFRPFFYYKKEQIIGCHRCNETNIKKYNHYFGYGLAFRTAFKTLLNHEKFKGLVILRTFSPAHFENGEWNNGGNCVRTRPFTKRQMKLEGYTLEMYLTQVREFMAAKREGSKRGIKFRLLDTTESIVLRPDGHPNHYGHWPHENKTTADCVHWCMPGPIDTWNEFLLQVLKMETPESNEMKLHISGK